MTHDVELVADHADRVIAIDRGRVILDGDPVSVFEQRDALARIHVRPPDSMEIARLAGFKRPVLTPNELLAELRLTTGPSR